MTCVPDAGSFAEMWWFDTSTCGWERVDNTTVNGAAPSARYGHVMTSVGLDLWLHGGMTYSGDGDSRSTRTNLLPELWRFDTSTRGWERVDTTINGVAPSARAGHVMTSVGLDLWLHGGLTDSGEGDTCSFHVVLLRCCYVETESVTNLNLHTEPFVGSAELWRFDTFTRGWERVDKTADNGAEPSARFGHVMTSVGLDLWMHGGSCDTGKGDA
jgi:hypothetical protein